MDIANRRARRKQKCCHLPSAAQDPVKEVFVHLLLLSSTGKQNMEWLDCRPAQ